MADDRAAEAARLFDEAKRLQPAWNDKSETAAERRTAATALFVRAAELGHEEAMRRLASGRDSALALTAAEGLARMGDVGPLVSRLTRAQEGALAGPAVLEAARRGEAWAALTVADVYWLGGEDPSTGRPLTAADLAFGWVPATTDAEAEGRRWAETAARADWAPALLRLGDRLRRTDPEAAPAHLARALSIPGGLSEDARARAARWLVDALEGIDAPEETLRPLHAALAATGHEVSMCWLAERLLADDPSDAARAEGIRLYEAAAAAGSVDACRELGRILEEGLGVPVDLERARALYETAAELGADDFARERLAARFGLTWYLDER